MVAVPIPRSGSSAQPLYPQTIPAAGSASFPAPAVQEKSPDWTHFLAAATLLTGGALIATGHRKAGMAVAAAGTAMALLEEQETVKAWWNNLPGYLDDAQTFLDSIEAYLKEASIQGHRIQSILKR